MAIRQHAIMQPQQLDLFQPQADYPKHTNH